MKVQLVCLCLLALGSLAYAGSPNANFDYDETGKTILFLFLKNGLKFCLKMIKNRSNRRRRMYRKR